MAKKVKKTSKNKTKRNIYVIITAVVLLLACFFVYIFWLKPFYKTESRVIKITEENKKREEQVLSWLRVQGTNIDYPVIYNADDTDVTKIMDYNFVWMNRKATKLTNRPIIFGHNIRNVSTNPLIGEKNHSRFEQLMAFIYPDFVKDNKYIQYTIDGKDYLYKIYSVAFVKNQDVTTHNSLSKKELNEYIKQSIDDSYFDFDVDVNDSDNIITLVTCTRFFGATRDYDFKIDARLVRNNERITNYSFKEKKSYDKIKKIIKGDESNEEA